MHSVIQSFSIEKTISSVPYGDCFDGDGPHFVTVVPGTKRSRLRVVLGKAAGYRVGSSSVGFNSVLLGGVVSLLDSSFQ
jgi:hypothetical protein